jgi:hypothetical protein
MLAEKMQGTVVFDKVNYNFSIGGSSTSQQCDCFN